MDEPVILTHAEPTITVHIPPTGNLTAELMEALREMVSRLQEMEPDDPECSQ